MTVYPWIIRRRPPRASKGLQEGLQEGLQGTGTFLCFESKGFARKGVSRHGMRGPGTIYFLSFTLFCSLLYCTVMY